MPALDVAPYTGSQPVYFPLAPLNPIDDETISITETGQLNRLTISGGQLRSGIIFNLAQNQVVTNVHLSLALKVSPALAVWDTPPTLDAQRTRSGRYPPNSNGESGNNVYRLDVPRRRHWWGKQFKLQRQRR
ncbi:hypothetical protein BG74_01070 [Sodalis-like endosymbiont of Proechinophthirus fluctus]|uniref:cellulose biosynthesis cyclic di-GMP-binding regulatory protein BcsB n=1 Tax=Sodalis-like endosymbiont of Proechinophthirus fluctus TaxID=1462730 RepID=UPI0007A841FB|nr:cellulose biosynthesis cyclic di-GMP-binding regulatory protein BcsB [Sodalis-like endosymbiont of Proechinophthirus fluctus]KYP97709.1 hypothetical protein BG74_01070 [Sodalis-like endosymbiont of Proechinophthirus fluctus]